MSISSPLPSTPKEPHSLRIAIGQLEMHWTIEENVGAVISAVDCAARAGAKLIVLPELALTGFHRKIVALARTEFVAPNLQTIQAHCGARNICCAIGTPSFRDGAIFNSVAFIDTQGKIAGVVEKNGLTAAEATFFTCGTTRPVVMLCGLQTSAVLCIEIHDIEDTVEQFAQTKIDLIVWPGIMRPDPSSNIASAERNIQDAQTVARKTRSWIVQANWPNSLNYPAESEFAGRSVVIDPEGEITLRLPIASAGVAVFNLGETHFDWYPSSRCEASVA